MTDRERVAPNDYEMTTAEALMLELGFKREDADKFSHGVSKLALALARHRADMNGSRRRGYMLIRVEIIPAEDEQLGMFVPIKWQHFREESPASLLRHVTDMVEHQFTVALSRRPR